MSAQRTTEERLSTVQGLSEDFHEIMCVSGAVTILVGALLGNPRVMFAGIAIMGSAIAIDYNGQRKLNQKKRGRRVRSKRGRACTDNSVCR